MEEIKRQLNQQEYEEYIQQWKEENKELIDTGKCKKCFTECLPKWEKGLKANIGKINWNICNKEKVKFIYDDIEDFIEILIYNLKTRKILIKYNNKTFEITTVAFLKCSLGNLLNKKTSEFKIEVGQTFKDDKRNIIITDKEYRKKITSNEKWYKYTCNKCGWTEGWILEHALLHKGGCSCCRGLTVVEGINDIPTVTPWMVKYFQGGYDEAKLYSIGSHKKIYPICPDCGRVRDKKMEIKEIYKLHSIACPCSDNYYFSEKTMFSILEQININFEFHKIFDWSKNIKFKYYDTKITKEYDFYFKLDNEEYIIETHGNQHYEKSFGTINGAKSLEEEQENDRIKKELALKNGIKEENYIVIDCRKSTLEWIKNNDNGILNSRLNELFDLSKVNWLKVEEFLTTNLVKQTCEYWNKGIENTKEIGKLMNLSSITINFLLIKGNDLHWCNYNIKANVEIVEVSKNGLTLGYFKSATKLSKVSEELFGVKFSLSSISHTCRHSKTSLYKGYTLRYVTKKEYNKIA